MERSGNPRIGHTMRPSSEGAPQSTLEMEPRSTDLPLLQSLVDFYAFPGVPLRSTPGFYQTRLRRLRAHILGRSQTGFNGSGKPSTLVQTL